MNLLPDHIQVELNALPPAARAAVERDAIKAALQVAELQALGDGQFLKTFLELLKVLLPIILDLLKNQPIPGHD